MTYSRIIGTGGYLPEKVLTNKDLEKLVESGDIDTVLACGVDMQGRLNGKRLTGYHFLKHN